MNTTELRKGLVECPFNPEPNRAQTLRSLARASRVVRNVLENYGNKRKLPTAWQHWGARFSQLFRGLVVVPFPRLLPESFFRN